MYKTNNENKQLHYMTIDAKLAKRGSTYRAKLITKGPYRVFSPAAGEDELLYFDLEGMRGERFDNDAVPFLWMHDPSEWMGKAKNWRVKDETGWADIELAESGRAVELKNEIEAGRLTSVSIAFEIFDRESVETEDKINAYLVKDWEIYEVSLVSVPAAPDAKIVLAKPPSVGAKVAPEGEKEEKEMPVKKEKVKEEVEKIVTTELLEGEDTSSEEAPPEEKAAKEKGEEMSKIINELKQLRQMLKNGGGGGSGGTDTTTPAPTPTPTVIPAPTVQPDLERKFSFAKAIAAAASGRWTDAKLEAEMIEAAASERGQSWSGGNSFYVPDSVLHKMDLTAGGAGTGAEWVAEVQSSSFIDFLFNATYVKQLGATIFDGLSGGKLSIPKGATKPAVAWKSETTVAAETTPATAEVILDPQRLTAYTEYTKELVAQSSLSIENLIRTSLANAIAEKLDYTCIHGSGSGEPTGIFSASGVHDASDTNGSAPTQDILVEMEEYITTPNPNMGWLTSNKGRAELKKTEVVSGYPTFLWEDNEMLGYPAYASNNVSDSLTKGTGTGLTGLVLGDWKFVYIGFWGGVEFVVDPYTLATSGMIRVTVSVLADIEIARSEAFSIAYMITS